MTALDIRDRQAVKTACGVRTDPTHWAHAPIHAWARFTGETTLETWCGISVDLADGAKLTTDLIRCQGCGQASYDAWWGRRA